MLDALTGVSVREHTDPDVDELCGVRLMVITAGGGLVLPLIRRRFGVGSGTPLGSDRFGLVGVNGETPPPCDKSRYHSGIDMGTGTAS